MIEGYSLSLGDGNSWWIASDEDNLSVVSKIARIMQLEKSELNGSTQLVFSEILSNHSDETNHELLEYVRVSLSKQDWICYDSESIRIWDHKEKPVSLCEAKYRSLEHYVYLSLWNSMRPIYMRSILSGGIPFHTSSAELNGKAVLFAAPGGTGKSTCYRRLPDYWNRLSDDENLIVLGKDGKYRVHPFPTWSEYMRNEHKNTWNTGYSAPLSAVFFLEQAKVDEILPIGDGEAAFSMNRSACQVFRLFWNEASEESISDYRRRIFLNACEIARKVPAFLLRVTLNGKFWEKVEKVIS